MKARTSTTVLPVGFAVLVALAACGSKEAPPAAPATSASGSAAAPAAATTAAAAGGSVDAAQIYKINCSTCHGPEGKGDGVIAASLNPKPANLAAGAFKYDTNGNGTPGEIEDIMTIIHDGTAKHGGSPLMAPWPQFSDAQRQALAEYVKSLHTG